LLSRGVGAYEQEGAYIVLHRAGLLDKVESFFRGEVSQDEMNDWASALMDDTPGASTSHNAMKVGNMLTAMNFDIDGKKRIDHLFEAWTSDISGPELRRQIQKLFTADRPALQISNKVISFVILVSGRPDVLVFDRVQFRHLWGGTELEAVFDDLKKKIAKAKQKTIKRYGKNSLHAKLALEVDENATNIYDSLPVFDADGTFAFGIVTTKSKGIVKTKMIVRRSGISPLGDGITGLGIYEAIERSIAENVKKSYANAGIEYSGIGAFHWDSWLVESQQAIEHPTIKLIAKQDTSSELGVKQGKFTRIESGLIYRYDGNYAKKLLDGSGDVVVFDAETKRKKYTTDEIEKVIGKKIPLETDEKGNERTRPWIQELSEEERARFDQFLLSLGERRTPASGTVQNEFTDGAGRGSGDSAASSLFIFKAKSGRAEDLASATTSPRLGATRATPVTPFYSQLQRVLNPLHPRADGDAVAAGFKKRFPFSSATKPGRPR
jgi:hypothetical protein